MKDLFFNALISLTMEAFLELIIYSFLNLFTADFTLNGEVLGIFIMSFSLFCTLIFVPLSLIWALLTKNEEMLIKKEFKLRWKVLFEFINTKKKIARIYNLIYILKRLTFVMLCFFKNES
jgi:hypothetical protein